MTIPTAPRVPRFQLPEALETELREIRVPLEATLDLRGYGDEFQFIKFGGSQSIVHFLPDKTELHMKPNQFCLPDSEAAMTRITGESIMREIPNNFAFTIIYGGIGGVQLSSKTPFVVDAWDFNSRRFISQPDLRAYCQEHWLQTLPPYIVHPSEVNEELVLGLVKTRYKRTPLPAKIIFHPQIEIILDAPPHRAVFEWTISELIKKTENGDKKENEKENKKEEETEK